MDLLRLWCTTTRKATVLVGRQPHPLCGRLASDKPLAIEHLSTSQLRHLASIAEDKSVAHGDRVLLLDTVQEKLDSDLNKHWQVENGKGDFPARVWGKLFSFAGELYVHRGVPTGRIWRNCYDPVAPWYSTEGHDEHLIMRMDEHTHTWVPVSFAGAPASSWEQAHAFSTGHVLKGKFYLCGTTRPNLPVGQRQDDVRIYDLAHQEWKCVATQIQPKGCERPFIQGYLDELIQFGGRDREEHRSVTAEEALWTFDTTALTWQQRHPSGPLPEPRHAMGLVVVKDCAYLLVNQPFIEGRLEVYELDLATWVWRLLPCTGSIPPRLCRISPVVVQGQWLVCGGETPLAGDSVRINTRLYTFDFATLAWGIGEVGGEALQPRMEYMATCHQGSMVIMGGVQPDYTNPDKTTLKAADTVQQIRLRPVEPALNEPDLTLRRYNTKRDMRFMRKLQYLTDTTVALEGCGQEWQVHGLMLGSASTVFRHILEDVPPTGGKRKVLLTDMTPDTVELLLDWMYDSLEGCLNFTQAVDMFKAGHKLDIADLWQHCERILKAYVSHETCLQVANLAMDCHSSLLTEACAAFLENLEMEEDGHALAQELHAVLFPPELPPPSVMECTSPPLDQCPSHSIECTSHPIECSSHPLLGDWDEDDYDSSSEDEEVSLDEEVEHGKHQPAPIDTQAHAEAAADVKALTVSASGGTGAHQGAEGDVVGVQACGASEPQSRTPKQQEGSDTAAGVNEHGSQVPAPIDVPADVEAATSSAIEPNVEAGTHRGVVGVDSPSDSGTQSGTTRQQDDDPARGMSKLIQSGPGFGLGRFGWGLAKGAVKLTAATLCTVAIATLADKHTCSAAQQRHQIPSSPVSFWKSGPALSL